VAATTDADGDNDGSGGGAASTMKQLMAKLASLEQSDPAAAQKTLSGIADQLNALAKQAGAGSAQGQALSSLADKFSQAAKTGDLTPLQAKGAHHGHHAHGAKPAGGADADADGDNDGSSAASGSAATGAVANSAILAYQRFQQQDSANSVNNILQQALSKLG
jgi:hypothetical protein